MRTATVAALALILTSTACALPRWPVSGEMTSPYGLRFRGIMPDIHHGVDIAAPHGTPVLAMRSGVVRFAGVMSGYGNVVFLEHHPDLITIYAHLSAIDVQAGQEVGHRGQIGRVGSSGTATGAHLHFEILRRGKSWDPVTLLGAP